MSIAAPLLGDSAARITWTSENAWLEDLEDLINDLVARCNAANGSGISPVSLHSPQSVCVPMTAAQFDANMTAIQTALNAIQAASPAQSFRADNQISLFTRSGLGAPLTAWHRDTNYLTIQVCVNTILGVYILLGV